MGREREKERGVGVRQGADKTRDRGKRQDRENDIIAKSGKIPVRLCLRNPHFLKIFLAITYQLYRQYYCNSFVCVSRMHENELFVHLDTVLCDCTNRYTN